MTREKELEAARSMEPVQGTIEVDIPIEVLWQYFRRADLWPRWNKCFFWVWNKDLSKGRQLVWIFQPIKWFLPYKMAAIATIVEVEAQKRVTWEVTALPGFYARHTYHMEDLGGGRSRFGSYEKAMGWGFRLFRWFWLKHFTFVKDESLSGAARLDAIYRRDGRLDEGSCPPKNYLGFWLATALLLILLVAAAFGAWFYLSFGRQTHLVLAPQIYASLGGGGNSLIVSDGSQALLIDTKFWPGSVQFHHWISDEMKLEVETVVNTHYHYDHTRGNALYPGARFVAYENVPAFLQEKPNDAQWSKDHPFAVPTVMVRPTMKDAASAMILMVGQTEVRLFHPGLGHTHGDLCAYLPRYGIVMIGDLMFFGYYPFIDTSPNAGASLDGTIAILRRLASEFPEATFIPGHGGIARAIDLRNYADYLQDLQTKVREARARGESEDQAAHDIDLSRWHRRILPSFPDDRIVPEWATAQSNVRAAYALLQSEIPIHD